MENGSIQTDTTQNEGTGIKVKYNHKEMVLSPEDAANYAQKGMKLDSLKPVLDGISYLASARQMTGEETVRALVEEYEARKRQDYIEKYSDEGLADFFMERDRSEAAGSYEEADARAKKAQKQSLEERLAMEYEELRESFEEIKSFDDIPDEVLLSAKEEKLINAYLLYRHRQEQKKKRYEKLNMENRKKALGNISSGREAEDNVLTAFIKGLKGEI